MPVNPIPEGHQSVIPYLCVEDPNALVEFLRKTFGAQQTEGVLRPDGSVMHTQVKIGDSVIMIGGANPNFKAMISAQYLYVPDTDAVFKRALEAGGESVMEPCDMFYGDYMGGVKDPQGNFWWIGTRKEELAHDELQKRADEFFSKISS